MRQVCSRTTIRTHPARLTPIRTLPVSSQSRLGLAGEVQSEVFVQDCAQGQNRSHIEVTRLTGSLLGPHGLDDQLNLAGHVVAEGPHIGRDLRGVLIAGRCALRDTPRVSRPASPGLEVALGDYGSGRIGDHALVVGRFQIRIGRPG